MNSLDSSVFSFLFTDVEGSTRLWEQRPEAMSKALAAHDRILRDAIADAGGSVFSTAGDAFAAVFPSSSAAIAAASRAQRDLAHQPWPGEVSISVRMGVHTGPAQQRDGDYFGPTRNRAARSMSAAHGGRWSSPTPLASWPGT